MRTVPSTKKRKNGSQSRAESHFTGPKVGTTISRSVVGPNQ
ncbi:hypothetical protein [Limosilactobacillus vaginalis]